MSTTLTAIDVDTAIQRAFGAGNTSGRPALYNRRCRRAMRKRRKVVTSPRAVTGVGRLHGPV